MLKTELNLRHIRGFCEAAQRGSITAAADAVFLSPPALTQGLTKLEKSLGVALLTRKKTGITLTEPGETFFQRARRALRYLGDGAHSYRVHPKKKGEGFSDFVGRLTYPQLRALIALSRTRNFTWAAKSIGISQPSLHRAARDLERASGRTLFRRGATGIEFTPEAKGLELAARLAIAELNQGLAEIDAWAGREATWINVGCLPLARSRILPEAINRFAAIQPGVRFNVQDGLYGDMYRDLTSGELDFIIGALRDPPPTDEVDQVRLLDDNLAIVARADHPLAGRETVTFSEALRFPWVVAATNAPTRMHFDDLCAEHRIQPPKSIVETGSLIVMRGLLAGSDRLSIISRHQVELEISIGILVQIAVDLNDNARPIGLTTRRGWVPTKTQALFRETLQATCRDLAL